mgnify:CR=1 FL=1
MSDGEFTSDPANVTIRVNSPPIAKIKRYVVYEDSVLERDDEFGLISKGTDSELDDLSVVLVSEPQHGLLSLSNDGSFVYTPEADDSGFDVFEFALNDGYQNSTPVQCQIYIIDVDDAPVAKDDDFFVPPLGTVKEEKKKQRRERKFEEDPSMTKALVNLYFMITFLGVSVFSSSFLGILDDHNNGRKEISLARVVGALAGMFITNTSSKRVGQTRARKVAMKGLCPGCDEEVYTFFDNEEKGEGRGSIVEHECHCCGAQLVFESKRESNREGRIVLIANGRLNANE